LAKNLSLKAFFLIFILSGMYVFIFGESGLLERISLAQHRQELLQHIDTLKAENKELSERLKLYQKGGIPADDFINSGYISDKSKVVILKQNSRPTESLSNPLPAQDPSLVKHLRIIWVVISVLIILFYFSRQKPKVNREHGIAEL
jgi:hypothetical protein